MWVLVIPQALVVPSRKYPSPATTHPARSANLRVCKISSQSRPAIVLYGPDPWSRSMIDISIIIYVKDQNKNLDLVNTFFLNFDSIYIQKYMEFYLNLLYKPTAHPYAYKCKKGFIHRGLK